MDDREVLIKLINFIDLGIECGWNERFIEYYFNYDLSKLQFLFKEVLQKILCKNIILLDSDKIKEDVIASKTNINNIKFSDGIDGIERNKYSISWNTIKTVDYGNNINYKEEISKYSDDMVSQEFIDFLIKKYGVSKEEK